MLVNNSRRTVAQLLSEFKKNIESLLSEPKPMPLWDPPVEFKHCIGLNIPAPHKRDPMLLLHGLGQWDAMTPGTPLHALATVQNNTYATQSNRWANISTFYQLRL